MTINPCELPSQMKKTALNSAIAASTLAMLSSASAQVHEVILEEVMVTASRRAQSIQEVPYNISALTGDELSRRGVDTAANLFSGVPGVAFVEQGARSGVNNSNLIIRGINSTRLAKNNGPLATAPVVSTYINETPVFVSLNFDDIERVEILRGPQGTLYGSGSLGGSVRYIYNKPDFDGFSGSISVDASDTQNADGNNYQSNVTLNIPLLDNLAIRVNAGISDTAGFIDQPAVYLRNPDGSPVLDNGAIDPIGDAENFFAGQGVFESVRGANSADSNNFRIAARWNVSDTVQINLSHQQQSDNSDGTQMNSFQTFGEDSFNNATVIDEPFERDVKISALDVEFDMGFASFVASASTYTTQGEGIRDKTGIYKNFSFYESVYGTSPRPLVSDYSEFDEEGKVLEVRLVSNGEGTIDWLVGAFYLDQDTVNRSEQSYFGYDDYSVSCFELGGDFGGAPCGFGTLFGIEETNGPLVIQKDLAYLVNQDYNFDDFGLFGELTWHVSDRWQVTGGMRYFDQEFSTTAVGGLVFVPDAVTSRSLSTKEDGVLFKANTSYELTENMNLYAVWSEGFRRAGANGTPEVVNGVMVNPATFTYDSDTTENFEVGVKGFLGKYSYTLAYFNIEWDDIQVTTSCTSLALGCVVNAGTAISEGVELEFVGEVIENLRLGVGYSYTDATIDKLSDQLKEFNQDGTLLVEIAEGAKLPGTNDHQFSLNANYQQMLSSGNSVLYNVDGSYRSEAESEVTVGSLPITGFWLWNFSVMYDTENWSVRGYVNNLADERGLLGKDPTSVDGPTANAIISRPRTYGVKLEYRFD